jgi:glutaredoxin 3
VQEYLQEITGGRSVPRVFVGGKFIGGGDDTARLKRSGELQVILQQAGALAA